MSHKAPEGMSRAGLSRRAFLKGSGLSAAATALAGPAEALARPEAAVQAAPAFGPAPVTCQFHLNGQKVTTQIEPRVTLLDALRDYVDHTAPKRVCDRGTCGACTVLVDGKPIYSCMTLALEVQGKKLETSAALMTGDGKGQAVPAAFVQHDAQQCGFCTPGFVVAMNAAFANGRKPSPDEVETALCGNICRCGTYQQMRDALRSLCQR